MPKNTFLNLDPAKKKTIFDAAVREFASRRFSDASINQIIKEAGISRGSFYQYFAGKEDLYLYVLSEIGKEKMAVAFADELPAEADFFEAYMHMHKKVTQWAKEQPLYTKIGMLMEYDDSEFIAKLMTQFSRAWSQVKDLIDRDKELGRIRPDADSQLVMQILYNQNSHLIREYYRSGDEEKLLRQVQEVLKIIQGGIAIV